MKNERGRRHVNQYLKSISPMPFLAIIFDLKTTVSFPKGDKD
jgi:hypothetical protein